MEARKMDKEQVRAALRQIRDTKGNDGKGLAGVEAATGISRPALSQLVNNGYMPDPHKLETLAKYLGSRPRPPARRKRLWKCLWRTASAWAGASIRRRTSGEPSTRWTASAGGTRCA